MKDKLKFGKRRYFQQTIAPPVIKRQGVTWKRLDYITVSEMSLEDVIFKSFAVLDTIPRKLRKGTPPHKALEHAEKVANFQSKRYYYEQIG